MSPHNIKKEIMTLEERGLPKDSYFHVIFSDGTERKEHDTNWTDMSENRKVKYQEGSKSIMVSTHKVKHIKMFHGNQNTELDVPDDCEVYQAIRAEKLFLPSGREVKRIHGRVVGLVKNNEVVEERFINGLQGVILGWRK